MDYNTIFPIYSWYFMDIVIPPIPKIGALLLSDQDPLVRRTDGQLAGGSQAIGEVAVP